MITDSHYKDDDLLWYWFVNIRGIGLKTRKQLMDYFHHPGNLFKASDKDLAILLGPRQVEYLKASRNMNASEEGLKRLNREGTSFIHWESSIYPAKLRQLPDPPYGLYLRGTMPDPHRPAIAVIGSRRSTYYGRRIAEELACDLASLGVQIISGLAVGIDASGHRGALKAGGYTLGILGGGIDSIYPRENFNLYMEMYRRGGVLSEWNIGVSNHAGLFPARNRLISALSDGIAVIEAAGRSGTFITVDQALEQGKTVFALPGRVTDINSLGTNQLIRDGAVPLISYRDILEHLELSGFQFTTDVPPDRQETGLLSEEMKLILNLLDEQDPKDYSFLLKNSGLSISQLSHLLYELEISGYIFQPRQNIYLKIFLAR